MCGIAGYCGACGVADTTEKECAGRLEALLAGIVHRGPDDAGITCAHNVAIGMRRLSIIDLAGGHQPMLSGDGRYALVFNGEIYNFRELRSELAEAGYSFATNSDSEVLLKGYMAWGRGVLDRLDGMFAFAVHDRHAGTVFLARDHLGIKPLYYIHLGGVFAFCSEPAPLLELPQVRRRLDHDALAAFLSFKYVPAPDTFIKDIKKLAAGHTLEYSPRGDMLRTERYWQLQGREGSSDAGELAERLTRAVDSQMVSDVPLGVFLSGGIDSGLLTWAAAGQGGEHFTGGYTVAFDETGRKKGLCAGGSFDESRLAALSAAHLGVPLSSTTLASPAQATLDDWIRRFQEPFANTSIPANFLLCQWVARHVKVALNGSGADELFGGYDRYYAVHPPAALRALHCAAPLLRRVADMLPVGGGKNSLVHRARRYLAGCALAPAQKHAGSIRLFTDTQLAAIAPGVVPATFVQDAFAGAPQGSLLYKATWTDMQTMLPDDYLTLVDRTSMAASLEVRVPFLARDFVQYAFSLPPAAKIAGWKKKTALRALAAKHLPEDIARQPKMGFESPVGRWFRDGLGEALCRQLAQSPLQNIISVRGVQALAQSHSAGQVDAAKPLLALYTLVRWMDMYRVEL
jgi:asparagine synthase (glutamine-hydrolysing)